MKYANGVLTCETPLEIAALSAAVNHLHNSLNGEVSVLDERLAQSIADEVPGTTLQQLYDAAEDLIIHIPSNPEDYVIE